MPASRSTNPSSTSFITARPVKSLVTEARSSGVREVMGLSAPADPNPAVHDLPSESTTATARPRMPSFFMARKASPHNSLTIGSGNVAGPPAVPPDPAGLARIRAAAASIVATTGDQWATERRLGLLPDMWFTVPSTRL